MKHLLVASVLAGLCLPWPQGLAATQSQDQSTAQKRSHGFPKTAFDYAKMVEPELGVPPKVDLGKAVEIPIYVDGKQRYGNLGRKCDNPTYLGKATMSGSVIQRYEGRTADDKPLRHVVWVAFGRNASDNPRRIIGSVQMIGYNRKTGATAFFESSDRIGPWVRLDRKTLRMRGVMPWIDDPKAFNRAFRTPGGVQCVECHQNDPFITDDFITAAKIPGTDEPVVPILDEESPYYVVGGEDWDMRTIHIEGNGCFDCHRVGLSTMRLFQSSGWKPNEHMPPEDPGSLATDLQELLEAWRKGPEKVKGAEWIVPPARGKKRRVVGADYPHQAEFNLPDSKRRKQGKGKLKRTSKPLTQKQRAAYRAEADKLLKQLPNAGVRRAFENWFRENGVDAEALDKLRSMAKNGGKKKGR